MLAPNHNNPQINTQLYTQLYNTWNTSQILCSEHCTQQQIVSTEHTVMYKALHTATHSWALRHICIVMNRAHNYAQIPKLFTESQIFSTEHTVMYKAQSYVQRTQLCTKNKVMYRAHSYVQSTKLCTEQTVMYKEQSYAAHSYSMHRSRRYAQSNTQQHSFQQSNTYEYCSYSCV